MCEVIVITSGKGGAGKTTAVANIGSALAHLGKKTALIDTDIGLRNLDVVLGLEDRIVFDIADVACGDCDLRQALVTRPEQPLLSLLPAAQTRDKSAVSPEDMRGLIEQMREGFDFVLIDCPAGIGGGFRSAISGADRAIVVTNPEMSAVRDADRVIGLLGAHDIPRPMLIINKIRTEMVRRGDMMSVADVLDILDARLLGAVPDDETVIKAVNLGMPVVSMRSAAGAAYAGIARELAGIAPEPVAEQEKMPAWRQLLRRVFGGKEAAL